MHIFTHKTKAVLKKYIKQFEELQEKQVVQKQDSREIFFLIKICFHKDPQK